MVLSFSLFAKAVTPEEGGDAVAVASDGSLQSEMEAIGDQSVSDNAELMSKMAAHVNDIESEDDVKPEGEQTPEEKPEETQETQETQDEQVGVDDSAGDTDGVDDSAGGDTEEPNSELLEAAKSYGYTASEVEDFNSAEEFERAMRLFDKQMAQSGRQIVDQNKPPETQPPVQQQQAQPPVQQQVQPPKPPPTQPQTGFAETEAQLKEAGYDDQIISVFRQQAEQNQQLGTGFKELVHYLQGQKQNGVEQQQVQAQKQQKLDDKQFFEFMDDLGNTKLFGSANSPPSDGQHADIDKLYDEVYVLRTGLQGVGRDASLTKEMVQRAFRNSHPGEIQKESRKAHHDKVAKQSRRRMGSGQTTRSPKNAPWSGEPENNPVLIDYWNKVQKENGNM